MITFRRGMLILVALIAIGSAGAEIKLAPLWTVNVNTFLESAATLADINGDGRDEVLLAGREEMIALGASGNELWRWRTPGRFMTYPAVLVRNGQPTLIYAADTSGRFTCLDGSGKECWHAQLKGPSSWSSAVVLDCGTPKLSLGVAPSVVQTDETGAVWAFDAAAGTPIWQAAVKGSPISPAAGDVNRDGKPEIAVATNAGMLTLLASDGGVLWERSIGGSSPTWATSAPILFAASGGSVRIAAAASEGRVWCFDAQGNVLWNHATRGSVASTLSAGDLDRDGRADVFLITQTGVIYRFDENGRTIWEIDMQGRSLAAGAIIDINNDGRLEYVLCTQSGRLLILDDQGQFIYEHTFDNRTINVTPTFGDVTADSPGLEMVISGGESGRMFCFGTQIPADVERAFAPWIAYRADARKTGSWIGNLTGSAASMTPQNLAPDQLATGDRVCFSIAGPSGKALPLKADVWCVRPDGARQAATSSVLGERGELQLPVDIVCPGAYRFAWSLADAANNKILDGSTEIFLQPFANDRALAARALQAMRATADSVKGLLPLASLALDREAEALNDAARALAPLQDGLPGAEAAAQEETLKQAAALVARARRASHLAEVIKQAAAFGPGTSVVAFEGATWENRKTDEQLPERVEQTLTINRRVVPEEHEPVAVCLLNVTDRELQVRVQIDVPPGGPAVVAHRSVPVSTAQGAVAWDPLPELDETALVSIPPLSVREVWLDAQFRDVKPGAYAVKAGFQALNGAGVLDGATNSHDVPPPETAAEIAFTVLPFAMAPAGDVRMCCWATTDGPRIADMLEHGNNVFCVPLGEPQYGEQGHLAKTDYAKLDAAIAPLRGQDVVLLLQGLPALHGDIGSPGYGGDLKIYLDDHVAHLAAAGFDANHFALYPIDEPGGAGWDAVNKLVAFGKAVRAANPSVMIYVDGGGELPMFQALAPYIDIWCPSLYMLSEQTPEMDVIRKTGKTLWSYNCGYGYATATRSSLKDTNIVAEHRTAALFALRYGGTGIGFWCYNIGPDPWSRVENDYPIVYPGRTKPVTSRRWEAVREGIEDARILIALRKEVEDTRLPDGVRARIRTLFDARLPGLVDRCFNEMKLGLARYVIDATNNDAVMHAFRNEMLDCVESVCVAQVSK